MAGYRSLPIHEHIKTQDVKYKIYIDDYKRNIPNLPQCGVTTVINNLMPVLDWTRTNPTYILSDGSKTSRFKRAAFIAFGIFIQKQPCAKKDYKWQEITKSKTVSTQ